MTLPIQPLCNDNSSLPLRGVTGRRRICLSAAWADPPSRRERRRAICSWSVGYGTLTELEESPIKLDLAHRKGKVADNGTLLEPRGRRLVSSIATTHASPPTSRRSRSRLDLLAMPGIKTLVNRRRNSGTPEAQQPLQDQKQQQHQQQQTTAALIKRNGNSSGNLIRPAVSLASLQKYETVLALTEVLHSSSSSSSTGSMEPLQPVNRLRSSPHGSNSQFCSRCSSILTLASTSRYSLNSSLGGFIPVAKEVPILCKLCLTEVPSKDACRIQECSCSFCAECMRVYVEFEIAQGAYDISCPDALCPSKGVLREEEIKRLAGTDLFLKHMKYRLNREIELDKCRTWCPRAGCETICNLCPTHQCQPQSVHCPNCITDFCSNCKLEWHEGLTCDENNKKLAKEGRAEEPGIPFNSDLIKCCPMCNVPIEKDEGCAQMMCKRCKHVFCWYCLASLDDDFLLRHYDKGPCKNKLGHSRASVIWHRTQVIGIFAGFGILLLVASPLLLLAAPCIVCCKCRVCNAGATKLENEDELPPEES